MAAADPVRPTTGGEIALGNLAAQIDGLERTLRVSGAEIDTTGRLVALLEMRGRFVGRIADYERAEELAEALVVIFPEQSKSLLVRARTRALLHRFGEARSDLARVRQLGGAGAEYDRLLASIDQATGRFAAALAHRDRAAPAGSALELGARASLHGEQGEIERATRDFAAAHVAWRASTDISPFTPAWLEFEEGLLWMRRGEWESARVHLLEATRRLPGYVLAQGHLAEVEAELGESTAAIVRLRAIVSSSDDPDYAHQLARLLLAAGQAEEAERWRLAATQRFDELTQRYPEAFADHAAEFWLGIGGDPAKALALARLNAKERRMPRAYELWLRSALAQGDRRDVCAAAAASKEWEARVPALLQLTEQARQLCVPQPS